MAEAEASEQSELEFMHVGEKLRMAREGQDMTLADVSARTRVAQRYLAAIEQSDYDHLPGRTYAIGFVRAFARAVNMPEAEMAAQLRKELSDTTFGRDDETAQFEPADPAQVPTRRLAWFAAIIAVLMVGGFLVWRNIVLDGKQSELAVAGSGKSDLSETAQAPVGDADAAGADADTALASTGGASDTTVTLVALDDVWIGFDDASGKTENWRTLRLGQPYQVPADYIGQFTLRTSQPNLLQVKVGDRELGLMGDKAVLVKNISLKPADLQARLVNPDSKANNRNGASPDDARAQPRSERPAGTRQ